MDWFKKNAAAAMGAAMLLGTLARVCGVLPEPPRDQVEQEDPFQFADAEYWGHWEFPELLGTAHALSNPLTAGSNISMNAPNNFPKRIPAAGAECAVTIQVDFLPRDGGASITTPVCSGYNPTTPLVPLTKYNCMFPLCTDATKCVATWVVRDAKVDALWILAIDAPTDGGVPVRVERGTGCKAIQ